MVRATRPVHAVGVLTDVAERGRTMRILVIGGTGFTGPHVVRRLHELGHELVLYHRSETGADLPDGIRHVHGDR